jgi:hypothetical protein
MRANTKEAAWAWQLPSVDLKNQPKFGGLFQRVVDRREHVVEIGAETIHSRDNSNRDAGRDQSVFNGRGAELVPPEP